MTNKKIIRVSLEEILEKSRTSNLKGKEYLIDEGDRSVGENLISARFKFKGADKQKIYVGSKLIEIDEEKVMRIDKEGLPYFEIKQGPFSYKCYEESFRSNTSYCEAIEGSNQNILLTILKNIKKDEHPVYQKFQEYIRKIIKLAPKIKEAHEKAYFLKDKENLKKFSSLDKTIFNYLTTKKQDYSSDWVNKGYYNPDNHEAKNINLEQDQQVDFKTGSTKEEAAFIIWYRNYMRLKSYEKKQENPWKKSSKFLLKWVKKLSKELESNGFKKTSEFTSPKKI